MGTRKGEGKPVVVVATTAFGFKAGEEARNKAGGPGRNTASTNESANPK